MAILDDVPCDVRRLGRGNEHSAGQEMANGQDPRRGVVASSVTIRDHAVIYAHAVILPQAQEIGRHAMVAAGAVVNKPVPPYSIVGGVPAKVLKFIAPVDDIIRFEQEHYPAEQRIPETVLREYERKYLN